MKSLLKIFLVLILLISIGPSDEKVTMYTGIMADPRPSFVHKVYSQGKKIDKIKTPYILIAWAPHPKSESSEFRTYQIWGSDHLIDLTTAKSAIQKIVKDSPADIYVVGNNWGAGIEFTELMEELSKEHKIEIYRGGHGAFKEVKFRPESEERQKEIANVLKSLQKKTK